MSPENNQGIVQIISSLIPLSCLYQSTSELDITQNPISQIVKLFAVGLLDIGGKAASIALASNGDTWPGLSLYGVSSIAARICQNHFFPTRPNNPTV